MNLTNEQKDIINCNDGVIIVNAFAGASKTTTIVEWCKQRPNMKILYLVFGKAMADEAKRIFKSYTNVEVRTTHSLAYRKFGIKYKHKLTTSYKAIDCSRDLGLYEDYDIANNVLSLFNKFLSSDYDKITDFVYDSLSHVKNKQKVQSLAKLCNELWSLSIDIQSDTPVTHDFYLKLYQMQHEDLGKSYDVLIIEEAQDSTMVVYDIFKSSVSCKNRIAIGDKHQSIFGFRNCVNLMQVVNDNFGNCTNLSLTGSFRINQPNADMCNILLGTFKHENNKMLGYNVNQKVFSGRNLNFQMDNIGQFNIIARNNATILAHAIEASQRGKWLYFEGGVKSYTFQFYKDLYWFRATGNTYNAELRRFDSWAELNQYANDAEDVELLSGINFINSYSKRVESLPDAIDKVFEYAIEDKNSASFCYCTAHKSKGLTLDKSTFIENDFLKLNGALSTLNDLIENYKSTDVGERFLKSIEQEINLLYVAITRAKGDLYLNEDLSDFFCI